MSLSHWSQLDDISITDLWRGMSLSGSSVFCRHPTRHFLEYSGMISLYIHLHLRCLFPLLSSVPLPSLPSTNFIIVRVLVFCYWAHHYECLWIWELLLLLYWLRSSFHIDMFATLMTYYILLLFLNCRRCLILREGPVSSAIPFYLHSHRAHLGYIYILHTNSAQTVVAAVTTRQSVGCKQLSHSVYPRAVAAVAAS